MQVLPQWAQTPLGVGQPRDRFGDLDGFSDSLEGYVSSRALLRAAMDTSS
jgi:hypothetical protein